MIEHTLSDNNREVAEDIISEIISGEMSYEDAIQEVNETEIYNRDGTLSADNKQQETRDKILKYIEWRMKSHQDNIPAQNFETKTTSMISSASKELKWHKINRGVFLFMLIVVGIHILCALNTTYNGYSLMQIGGKSHVTRKTEIQYFGLFPVWISNIFYVLYVVYGILLIYSTTGMIAHVKRNTEKE